MGVGGDSSDMDASEKNIPGGESKVDDGGGRAKGDEDWKWLQRVRELLEVAGVVEELC